MTCLSDAGWRGKGGSIAHESSEASWRDGDVGVRVVRRMGSIAGMQGQRRVRRCEGKNAGALCDGRFLIIYMKLPAFHACSRNRQLSPAISVGTRAPNAVQPVMYHRICAAKLEGQAGPNLNAVERIDASTS